MRKAAYKWWKLLEDYERDSMQRGFFPKKQKLSKGDILVLYRKYNLPTEEEIVGKQVLNIKARYINKIEKLYKAPIREVWDPYSDTNYRETLAYRVENMLGDMEKEIANYKAKRKRNLTQN